MYIIVGLTLLGQVVILYLIERHYRNIIREREVLLGSEAVGSTRQQQAETRLFFIGLIQFQVIRLLNSLFRFTSTFN